MQFNRSELNESFLAYMQYAGGPQLGADAFNISPLIWALEDTNNTAANLTHFNNLVDSTNSASIPALNTLHAAFYGSWDFSFQSTLVPTVVVNPYIIEAGFVILDIFTGTLKQFPCIQIISSSVTQAGIYSNVADVNNQVPAFGYYSRVINSGNTGNCNVNFTATFSGYKITGF